MVFVIVNPLDYVSRTGIFNFLMNALDKYNSVVYNKRQTSYIRLKSCLFGFCIYHTLAHIKVIEISKYVAFAFAELWPLYFPKPVKYLI